MLQNGSVTERTGPCRRSSPVVAAALLWLAAATLAATVVVNDASDALHGGPGGCAVTGTGTCSLRDAITFANAAAGITVIRIQLPGASSTIAVGPGGLPDVTARVDLQRDPGFATVTIDGVGAGSATGLRIAGSDSILGGVTIRRFGQWGLRIDADRVTADAVVSNENQLAGVLVAGSQSVLTNISAGGNLGAGVEIVGTGNSLAGVTAATNNGGGVILSGSSNILKKPDLGANNSIHDNLQFGVMVAGNDNQVRTGTINSNLGPGVRVGGQHNTVAPLGISEFLQVDANQGSGIDIVGGAQHSVQVNAIGFNTPNGGPGVIVHGGATQTLVASNTIRHASAVGIQVGDSVSDSATTGATLRFNQLFGTGQHIDLGGDGPTPNDPLDADVGPNELQNFPTLSVTSDPPGTVTVTASLNSVPLQTFVVDVLAVDPTHWSFLGTLSISTDVVGNGSAAGTYPLSDPFSMQFLATATSPSGSTSELSDPVVALAPPPRSFHTVTPCRIIDTRGPASPVGGPALIAGGTRTFPLAGACGIPSTARALSVNVTITGPTASGSVVHFVPGASRPVTSFLNYRPGQTRANNAIAALGPAGDVSVYCGQGVGTAHLVLDVNGYFE